MSEETQEEGGMSTIKKTILGLVTTVVTGAGAYVATHIDKLFGVEEEEKTEVAAPVPTQAPAPIILNVDNSSKNTNSGGGGTTVIKETKVVEKPVKEEKSESEDAPW
jgi:hypothetical protein